MALMPTPIASWKGKYKEIYTTTTSTTFGGACAELKPKYDALTREEKINAIIIEHYPTNDNIMHNYNVEFGYFSWTLVSDAGNIGIYTMSLAYGFARHVSFTSNNTMVFTNLDNSNKGSVTYTLAILDIS